MPPKIREYDSADITIRFDLRQCIHAQECVHGHAEVFQEDRKPWIDAAQGSPDDIAAVIHRCPTGALTYERKDAGPQEEAPQRNTVKVDPDGPLFIHGALTVHSANGEEQRIRMALCRCGASRNTPFCDNSHKDIDFKDPGKFERQPATAELGGPLTLTVRPNGSVLAEGNFLIESGDGDHAVLCSGKLSFCRCGQSANKPFCDGTHKKVGFEAE